MLQKTYQKIKTERIDKFMYVLTKIGSDKIEIKQNYKGYGQWANCTEIEHTIRLTPTKGVIETYYFSDMSGQQHHYNNKTYVNREELEETLILALEQEQTQDEAQNFKDLESLFTVVHCMYMNRSD